VVSGVCGRGSSHQHQHRSGYRNNHAKRERLTIQDVLRPQHRDRALTSNQASHLQSLLFNPLQTTLNNPADESHRDGFGCGELPTGKGKLSSDRIVTNNLGETLKGSDICCETNIDFLCKDERAS
jgi:hypothetical protein